MSVLLLARVERRAVAGVVVALGGAAAGLHKR